MKLLILSIGCLLSIKGCNFSSFGSGEKGSGNIVERSVQLTSGFDDVKINCSADVTYEVSEDAYVKIDIDENLQKMVVAEVTNGSLDIHHEGNMSPTKYKIRIGSPSLKSIGRYGSGTLYLKGKVKADSLTIDMSGSGSVTSDDVVASYLLLKKSGSGDMNMKGQANKVAYSASGSGDLNARDLQTKVLSCDKSGSGDVSATVTDSLFIDASGSGDFTYWGSPVHVDQRISGSGSIKNKK